MTMQLAQGLELVGIAPLAPDASARLELFGEILRAKAGPRGFIGRSTVEQIQTLHLVDSLAALPIADEQLAAGNAGLADVGTGAGLPGLALSIARPALVTTLIDSSRRRCEFLRETVSTLGLEGVSVLNRRAEDAGQDPAHRGRFDVAVIRAVLPASAALELTLPLLRLGGLAVLYVTAAQMGQVEAAEAPARLLGGRLKQLRDYSLPGLRHSRLLAVFEKIAPTPDQYPRRAGIPRKRPIA